jgi:hypothetical protein
VSPRTAPAAAVEDLLPNRLAYQARVKALHFSK